MKELLQRAASEIRQLRRDNEVLTAQVGVIEVFAAAFGLKHGPRGFGIDVAWELDKAAQSMKPELHEIKNEMPQQEGA